ncbi:hypothetical protein ACFXPS_19300 [Nocardia sp. NPDC059091]|uniref:hypothetical protein n=1 Tax=unclassified Nocardia TaxID=2637762 RepID=UPI0036CF3C14
MVWLGPEGAGPGETHPEVGQRCPSRELMCGGDDLVEVVAPARVVAVVGRPPADTGTGLDEVLTKQTHEWRDAKSRGHVQLRAERRAIHRGALTAALFAVVITAAMVPEQSWLPTGYFI